MPSSFLSLEAGVYILMGKIVQVCRGSGMRHFRACTFDNPLSITYASVFLNFC